MRFVAVVAAYSCRIILFAATIPLLLVPPLAAQTSNGRIFGVITDESGAVVQRAQVHVVDVGKNASREAITANNGSYQVLQLGVGTYKVVVESNGFIKGETTSQALNLNQALRVDITLKVGASRQTVEVSSETSNVESVSATLGASVTNRPILDLPLNGRNVLDLALLRCYAYQRRFFL